MESRRPKSSVYERFAAGFVRTQGGALVQAFGPSRAVVEAAWDQIREQVPQPVEDGPREPSQPLRAMVTAAVDVDDESVSLHRLLLFEKRAAGGGDVAGIAIEPGPDPDSDAFFAGLILQGMRLDADRDGGAAAGGQGSSEDVTDAIVDHFDATLRHTAKMDMWKQGGRDFFRQRVGHYVSRGMRVEFCLPAFPCKSSNLDKVHGPAPDRGEYIALSSLHDFVEGIERLYRPGARLWIISDGHVFSDCIGVDDAVVDAYGAQLAAMDAHIAQQRGGAERLAFRSLPDMLAPARAPGGTRRPRLSVAHGSVPPISHLIATARTDEAEASRRILLAGFQLGRDELRRRLDARELDVLALYLGFAKFMLQDLESNRYTRGLSQSQRRRLSTKVAFEMIQRNQAYSNLVEIMFPHQVRLSIHAHKNSGPKFGIRMMGPSVRPANELSPEGHRLELCHGLHVPTPWHNCVVQIEGHPSQIVTRSSTARAALSSGAFIGGWTGPRDTGAHYHLKRTPCQPSEPLAAASTSSAPPLPAAQSAGS